MLSFVYAECCIFIDMLSVVIPSAVVPSRRRAVVPTLRPDLYLLVSPSKTLLRFKVVVVVEKVAAVAAAWRTDEQQKFQGKADKAKTLTINLFSAVNRRSRLVRLSEKTP